MANRIATRPGSISKSHTLYPVEVAPAYVPSKHAVVGITRQLAIDYAKDKIHVNCLCPGYVDSPFLSKLTWVPHPLPWAAMTDSLRSSDREATAAVASMHPWTGLGKPEDIADAALFLAGDEASW